MKNMVKMYPKFAYISNIPNKTKRLLKLKSFKKRLITSKYLRKACKIGFLLINNRKARKSKKFYLVPL